MLSFVLSRSSSFFEVLSLNRLSRIQIVKVSVKVSDGLIVELPVLVLPFSNLLEHLMELRRKVLLGHSCDLFLFVVPLISRTAGSRVHLVFVGEELEQLAERALLSC